MKNGFSYEQIINLELRRADKSQNEISLRSINHMQKTLIVFISALLIYSCSTETEAPVSVITVNVDNQQLLDSLIVYDKDNSWENKAIIRFKTSNKVIDTMPILEKKRYQIYSFTNGKQDELGELMLSPNSKVSITINEQKPFESIAYSGTFSLSNNYLAYAKNYQHQLTEMVRNGIAQAAIERLITKKKELIIKKGDSLNIPDSLKAYVIEKYDNFSAILKKKNTKYLYKASLIDTIGNQFSLKDINNKTITLADFKGKYVYIDVWATWCKPCKVEYPFFKELEEKFSDTDALQIISISTDSDYDKWKAYLLGKAIGGTQLYSGAKSDFVKFYDIGALPRFILLDKSGRVISPDELRPSNPELSEKIA